MLIFVLDDEPLMLTAVEKTIRQAVSDAEVRAFPSPLEALKAAEEEQLHPDIAFTDIEMPDMTGLEFAVRLKSVSPDTRIVFVTGYSQYAVDAFRVRAKGYIIKPLEPEAVLEELNQLPSPPARNPQKLFAQCFGYFEVYWQDEPLIFRRRQSKELLAYLINRRGAACSAEEIASALWEEDTDMKTAGSRVRLIIHDLRATLREIGMEDILIREHRQIAVHRDRIDCDYWRMLGNDVNAINAFHGEYMTQYSWAESTRANLIFKS